MQYDYMYVYIPSAAIQYMRKSWTREDEDLPSRLQSLHAGSFGLIKFAK